MKRLNIDSGSVWESQVGYSRAVRVGEQVFVTGTVAADESGSIHAPGDGYAQTEFIMRKIETALDHADASIHDIVRMRIYITDMACADAVGRAHREILGNIRPATTMVVVAGLWGEGSVVEIEADAILGVDEVDQCGCVMPETSRTSSS